MLLVTPAELRGLDARGLERLLGSRAAVVAAGEGSVRGIAAGALLLADYAVLHRDAMLHLDHPLAWAGAVWRLRDRAYRLHLEQRTRFTAQQAHDEGLCDGFDVPELANKSATAFDLATQLIARRGGDVLERAAFAHLFATGEPREGLTAFLEKRPPRFAK